MVRARTHKGEGKMAKAVKATVKLLGGTQPIDQAGIVLLNVEVEARKVWYATHDSGTPRKPYTPAQRSALRTLEKAKAALVAHTGQANFKEAVKAIGYAPQYAPRTRTL